MKIRLLIRFPIVIVCCFLLEFSDTVLAGLCVEQVQRDLQARYVLVTGGLGLLQWPACSTGQTPAPAFPKDGFYGDLTQDPDKGVKVVNDLVEQFYFSAIYEAFVKATQFDELEGVSAISDYTQADMPPQPDVNSNNYMDVLAMMAGCMQKLTLIKVQAGTAPIFYPSDTRMVIASKDTSCQSVQNCVDIGQNFVPWGHGYYLIDDCQFPDWNFNFSADPNWNFLLFSPIMCAFESVGVPGGSHIAARNTRGKIVADLTKYTKGISKTFLLLTTVPCNQLILPVWTSVAYGCAPTFAQERPTSAPVNTYGSWAQGSLNLGQVSTTGYLTGSDSALTPLGSCSLGIDDAQGWALADAVVIVAPDFTATPDPQDCCSCSQCEAGATSASLQSVHIDVNLGTDNFSGSAGTLTINAEHPSPQLSTPEALDYFAASTVEVIQDLPYPWPPRHMQFKTSQSLVNVQTNNPYQYVISVYPAGNVRPKDASGFYQATGNPLTTIVVENPEGATSYNRLRMTTTMDSNSSTTDYTYTPSTGQWQMDTGNGLRRETRVSTWDTAHTYRTETFTVSDSSNKPVHKEINTYRLFPWGQEKIINVVDPDNASLTNTWSFYENPILDGGAYRQLKQFVDANGHWIQYHYDQNGRENTRVSQFLNSPLGSPANLNRVTSTTYSSNDPQITVVDTLLGIEVGRRYKVIHSGEVQEIQCQTRGVPWNSPDNLVTVTKRYTSGDFARELKRIQHPNRTVEIYSYSTNSNQKITTLLAGVPDPSNLDNIIEGTQTVIVTALGGQILSQTSMHLAPGSPDLLISQDVYTYLDSRNRSYTVAHLDGTTEQYNYDCCGLASQIDRDGTTTQYFYDALKRQVASVRNGVTTSNLFDPNGALLATIRVGSDDSQINIHQQAFDLAGRLLFETNALNGVTAHTNFFDGSGQRTHQISYPDTGTRIETYAEDGSLLRIAGTAAEPRNYLYGVDNTGAYTIEIKPDAAGGTNEWVQTYSDLVGRAFKTVYPTSPGFGFATSFFNSSGQLTNTVDPDGVSILYAYNPKGELAYTVLDSNLNYSIDFSGQDRITFVTNDFIVDNGSTIRRSRTYVWNTSLATSNLLSSIETSADGLKIWRTIWNNGNPVTSRSETAFDPTHGNRFLTNTAADRSFIVSVYQYGALVSVTSFDSHGHQIGGFSYGYDSHDRQNTVTDIRTGTITRYFNDADQVSSWVTPPADGTQAPQVTTNYFDAMGRIWKITLPDNASVINEFYPTGRLKRTYGSQTYPAGYGYDSQGRMLAMTNWTSFAGGLGERITKWNYDPYTGFLIEKRYDGDTPGPRYTYTAAGRLQTRSWVRGIETAYSYNRAGDLTGIAYNDGSTTAVSFGYDRLGRQTFITNGPVVSVRTYNDIGQLITETYSGGALDGIAVTNAYDEFLRSTAVALDSLPSTLVQFGYDDASRLQTVTNGANVVTYTYLANSPLVQNISSAQNSVVRMTTTKTYDNLNRLLEIRSVPSADSAAVFNYQYNSLNQRTAATNIDNSRWVYGYDSLGQVTSGKKFWANGTPIAGQQFEYAFDDIGNRQSASFGGDSSGANMRLASYSANNLNQYSSRTVPGFVNILGSVNSNATVTIWGSDGSYALTSRKGEYFRGEYAVDNSLAPQWLTLTNLAVLASGGNPDLLTNTVGNVFVAQTPETFTYDADGNLKSDGRWVYMWDGENRLVSMVSPAGAPAASRFKLDFAYDYQGRRVQKIVSVWDGSVYVPQSTNRFVYDGWNLIAILDSEFRLVTSFVWGLDLSGSIYGAGGVGGLLLVNSAEQGTHVVSCDGNGNVSSLVSADAGRTSANYEYGPFGELLRATGPMSMGHPFRFSTKYEDIESGLLFYGYRYYSTSTGKWVSRDPIGELGCLDLYCFVGNDPLTLSDWLGLDPWYDRLGQWFQNRVDVAKPVVFKSQSTIDATIINTAMDVANFFVQLPSALGHAGEETGATGEVRNEPLLQPFSHLGEGTGIYYTQPTLENLPGLLQDISVVAGILSATPRSSLSARMLPKYRQLYNQITSDFWKRYRQGEICIPKGISPELHLGRLIDQAVRREFRQILQEQKIPEGPKEAVRVNRRLYDPSGTGDYVIPDVYFPNEGVAFEGTTANKTQSTAQIIYMQKFSNGGRIIIVRAAK